MGQSSYSRRAFFRFTGLSAASLALARRARAQPDGPPSSFEVSASLYAWELHDEGVEKILDNLQEMAAVNSVYLIALMHYEKRPLTSDVFPHNPVRKTWQAEDSRVYWHPDPTRYGRIKPRLSDYDWLNRTDWLRVLTEAARKRGLKTGVEISHTVLDAERGKGEFSDCVQRNIHGQPRVIWGRSFPVCLNNPDVRRYVLSLFSELTARYDVDYLQTCMLPFMPGDAAAAGCFCEACLRAAKQVNLDLEKIKSILRGNPQAQPEFDNWQAFRCESVAGFYRTMHDGVHAIRPPIDLRFNDCFRSPRDWGFELRPLKPYFDSVRVCDYSEQTGKLAALDGKRQWLKEVRLALGEDKPLLSAVAVRPKATPEIIRQGVRTALDCGVNGITLGHYDGAEYPMLRAVGESLKAVNLGPT